MSLLPSSWQSTRLCPNYKPLGKKKSQFAYAVKTSSTLTTKNLHRLHPNWACWRPLTAPCADWTVHASSPQINWACYSSGLWSFIRTFPVTAVLSCEGARMCLGAGTQSRACLFYASRSPTTVTYATQRRKPSGLGRERSRLGQRSWWEWDWKRKETVIGWAKRQTGSQLTRGDTG